jgi:hypothetical protein
MAANERSTESTRNQLPKDVPAMVRAYLRDASVAVADSLVLHVDEQWNYLGHQGDLARFDLQNVQVTELSALLKVLCIGLPRVRGTELKHVGLPNGRFVDLHLFSSKGAVHVLFLDVRVEVEKTRVWQQSAQETELKSYEKTREIRKQRGTLSELRKQRDQLAWALALTQARASVLRHELFAAGQFGPEHIAAALERADRHGALNRSMQTCLLEDIALALEKLAIAQINLTRQRNDQRPVYADPQQCAIALLPLLMFAHRRAGTNTPMLAAALKFERDTLLLSAHCGMQDLSRAESALAWERKLQDPKWPTEANAKVTGLWSPSDLALVLCAERQQSMGARMTRQYAPDTGLSLTLSLPVPAAVSIETTAIAPARTRVALAVGARCWLVSTDGALREIAATAIEPRGLVLEYCPQPEVLMAQLKANPPQVLLIDPQLSGAAKFAFSARSAGFNGMVVALRPFTGGAAIKAAFDYVCEQQSARTIAAVLFEQ